MEAVEILTGQTMADWKPPPPAVKKDEPKVLLLPPKNKNCDRVTEYLFGRGIDYQLIQECIAEGIIFESADYHNAVFIGKDESGTPKYAACRGTISSFKRDASGSDKWYSFRLLAAEPCASSLPVGRISAEERIERKQNPCCPYDFFESKPAN